MTYIQQYVGLSCTNRDINLTTRTGFYSLTALYMGLPGTGYHVGDVITLTRGNYVRPATAVVTSVDGSGGIRPLGASLTDGGMYYELDQLSVSGGSGSGAGAIFPTVTSTFCAVPALIYNGDAGFPSTLTQFSMSIWSAADQGGFVAGSFVPYTPGGFFSFDGYDYGCVFFGDEAVPQLYLNGISGGARSTILQVVWTNPFNVIPSVWNYLLSVDISTKTVQLYANDLPCPVSGTASWAATPQPIYNPSNAVWNYQAYGRYPYSAFEQGGGLGSMWMDNSFIDFSIEANRRRFIDAGGQPVDPTTFPSSVVNMYTLQGDRPSAISTNNGAGADWTIIEDSLSPVRWNRGTADRWLQIGTYNTGTQYQTPLVSAVTDTTRRPGGSVTYSGPVIAPEHGTLVFNTDGSYTYTPDNGYLGRDLFTYTATETMPAGYDPPGYSRQNQVQIFVSSPSDSSWSITSSLSSPEESGIGDLWLNNIYIDFSDPDIRSGFHNPDDTWKWLGLYGELATGFSPPQFLTITADFPDPSDFLYGYGQWGRSSGGYINSTGVDPTTGQDYADLLFDNCLPNALVVTDIQVIGSPYITPDDQVTLRWSDDAGASWSNGLLKSIGEAGKYFTAPTWYRLGMSRNRIFELSWSGSRAEALQGAFVLAEIAQT